MSSPKNRVTREISPKTLISDCAIGNGFDSSTAFNQGDLLVQDASTKLIKPISTEGEGATFLGIAIVTVVGGQLVGPYQGLATSSRQKTIAPGPQYGVIAKLRLKSGDALTQNAQVYGDPGDGPDYVQASGTKPIGIYQGPAITGISSTEVEVLLGARYPNDVLKF